MPFTIYHSPFTIGAVISSGSAYRNLGFSRFFLPAICLLLLPSDIGGTLHVERSDAAELLDIKRGAWPLEKVKTEAERLFQLAQEAYVRSSLPAEPDRPRAERLCVEMISEYHKLGVAT